MSSQSPDPLNPEPQSTAGDSNKGPQSIRYVAVDENGVPLPNQGIAIQQPGASEQSVDQPQVVYMSRPLEPMKPQISEETRRKHEESKRLYPFLNLSEGEYVLSAVRRHPIGLLSIWAVAAFALVVLIGGMTALLAYGQRTGDATIGQLIPNEALAAITLLVSILVLCFGYIATIIYNGNKFFLTNESVIQEIQTSLFNKREQTVSLGNIEDASYHQDGLIQAAVGYGSIRLSTEGDETTYRFQYVAQPKKQIALLNNAVESFKHGRPIGDEQHM